MENKKTKMELDKFHYHEAMDRTWMFCEILSENLLTHPVFNDNNELHNELSKVIDDLYKIYHKIVNTEPEEKE